MLVKGIQNPRLGNGVGCTFWSSGASCKAEFVLEVTRRVSHSHEGGLGERSNLDI